VADDRALSTRFTRRTPGGRGGQADTDTAVLQLIGLAATAAVLVALTPVVVTAALLAGVWAWRRWPRWLLLALAVVVLAVAAPFAGPLTEAATAAGGELLAEPTDLEVWARLLAVTAPAWSAAGALVAAGGLTWRRWRAPSWRGDDRGPGPRTVARRSRTTGRCLAGELFDHDRRRVLLGIDRDTGRPAGVPTAMLGRHTLVVGSTGSGKTTTALRLATAVLEQGGGLVVVDLKGDPNTVTSWRRAAAARSVGCHVWSLDGDAVYDPLAAGGVGERVRKVMALADWTEPYYRDQAEQLAQLALRTLDEVGERPTLARLHAALTPAGVAQLARSSTGPAGGELARETESMTPGRLSALESLRTKLGLLTQAAFGPSLDPDLAGGRPSIDLAAAIYAGDVVVVSLDELSFGHIAARMAEVVLTDVAAAAGARLRDGAIRPALVWVDEFSAMRPGPLASLFARVRSADIGLLLSTQEVSDLIREDPTFRAAVATNVATVLAHRVHDPESAEWLASLIGTTASWQETSQVEAVTRLGVDGAAGGATGLGTIRQVERYVVHPNRIKSLPDHQVVLARLDQPLGGDRARHVQVVPYRPASTIAAPRADAAIRPRPATEQTDGPPSCTGAGSRAAATAPTADGVRSEDTRDCVEQHGIDSDGLVRNVDVELPGERW
jgi:conjugal transfer pilus assembly protein TraD